MVSQHLKLKNDLQIVAELIRASDIVAVSILKELNNFKKDLVDHLELENGTFYPELLKEMREKNQDTTNTEKFISEMKDVENDVITFLKKYQNGQLIDDGKVKLKKEFPRIYQILNLRITSEEEGVYTYWGYSK